MPVRCFGAVLVDWGARQDPPLFKKYGVMNSGLVGSERYNDTIFDSLAAVRVRKPVQLQLPAYQVLAAQLHSHLLPDAGVRLYMLA